MWAAHVYKCTKSEVHILLGIQLDPFLVVGILLLKSDELTNCMFHSSDILWMGSTVVHKQPPINPTPRPYLVVS
jgi:hypothetical protein